MSIITSIIMKMRTIDKYLKMTKGYLAETVSIITFIIMKMRTIDEDGHRVLDQNIESIITSKIMNMRTVVRINLKFSVIKIVCRIQD